MPPPTPIFEKWVDENQVSYFIWPKGKILCCAHHFVHSGNILCKVLFDLYLPLF